MYPKFLEINLVVVVRHSANGSYLSTPLHSGIQSIITACDDYDDDNCTEIQSDRPSDVSAPLYPPSLPSSRLNSVSLDSDRQVKTVSKGPLSMHGYCFAVGLVDSDNMCNLSRDSLLLREGEGPYGSNFSPIPRAAVPLPKGNMSLVSFFRRVS